MQKIKSNANLSLFFRDHSQSSIKFVKKLAEDKIYKLIIFDISNSRFKHRLKSSSDCK